MYEVEMNSIRFSNGKKHQFNFEIAEVLDFGEALVVRLAADPLVFVANILGFDYVGNLLWKIPVPKTFEPRHPYVNLFRKGGYIEVLNWDGHVLTLHPKNGMILAENVSSGEGRHASARAWM